MEAHKRVISLFEMQQLFAKAFVQMMSELQTLEELSSRNPPNIPLRDWDKTALQSHLTQLGNACMVHRLVCAHMKIERMTDAAQTLYGTITYGSAAADVKELRERIIDELETSLWFQIPPDQAAKYADPLIGWEVIVQVFPQVTNDVTEANRCYACDRFGAAIFHILLVAEFGVIYVARLLGVEGDKPGWGALARLEQISKKKYEDKTPNERQHSPLLEQLLPLMFAMKNSWRHKINHAENRLEWLDTDFSPELATEIISAVQGFMRRLADDSAKHLPLNQ